MSWPVPASPGPQLPIPLPWAAREPSYPSWSVPAHDPVRRRGHRFTSCRRSSIRKAKYGAGMVAGLLVVHWTKRLINSIPFVNIVTRPFLDLLPTIVVGPALGAAAVYGMEQGDPLAARHVLAEHAQHAQRELTTIARDVRAELEARTALLEAELGPVVGGTARVAVGAVEEMERTLVPAIEREYRAIEARSRRLFEDGQDGPRR